MRSHWWWRPGWHAGRRFYTWHATFSGEPVMQRINDDFAPVVANLPLDPVPPRWMHLTMQGVGFTDDVSAVDLNRIVAAVREHAQAVESILLTLGPPQLDPEALILPARPTAQLEAARAAVRAGISDVWGSAETPEPPDGFRPHVTIAYSNSEGPAEPLITALRGHPGSAYDVALGSVSLIALNRDQRMYQWDEIATVQLSCAAEAS
jgi:2'-5' RNA ligase